MKNNQAQIQTNASELQHLLTTNSPPPPKKKKILITLLILIIIALALVFGLVFGLRNRNKTSGHSQKIATCNDLQNINYDDSSAIISLIANIDCQGVTFNQIPKFKGTFKGNGFSIQNLLLVNGGLFGENQGRIESLIFSNVVLEWKDGEESSIGIISNSNTGSLSNITLSGIIRINESSSYPEGIGGLVAISTGDINCTTTTISFSLPSESFLSYVGGVVGQLSGDNPVLLKNITSNIFYTYTEGISSAKSSQFKIGGIVGENKNTNSVVLRFITSNGTILSSGIVSGILGSTAGTIKILESEQNVTISGGYIAGGIIGRLVSSPETHIASLDKVSSYSRSINANNYVGGLIGRGSQNFSITVEDGKVILRSNSNALVGGCVAQHSGSLTVDYMTIYEITNSYYTSFEQGGVAASLSSYASFANVWVEEISFNSSGTAGGFIGTFNDLSSNLKIINAACSGKILGKGTQIGGAIGYFGGFELQLFLTTSRMNLQGTSQIGGLIGYVADSLNVIVSDVYFIGNINGENSLGGIFGEVFQSIVMILQSSACGTILGNSTSNSGRDIGGLIGTLKTKGVANISSCGVLMEIEGDYFIGGLVGSTENITIDDSLFYGNISISEITNENLMTGFGIGGLVGFATENISINNSYSFGNIFKGNMNVGGIIGETYSNSSFFNVSSSLNIIAKQDVGGIIGLLGDNGSALIKRCYYNGTITVDSQEKDQDVGGLVGSSLSPNTQISESYSNSTITANGNGIGGLIGSILEAANLENCFSLSSIEGKEGIGGLIGINSLSNIYITNCYSAGRVHSTSTSDTAGGLVGRYNTKYTPDVVSSYWDTETSGQTKSNGGKGENTEQMKKQETYNDWDFYLTWTMKSGFNYPLLNFFTEKI